MWIRRLWRGLGIAVRLGCPRCGGKTLFAGLLTMHARCSACELVFEREPGYWIGAIYINYAVTVSLSTAGFLLVDAYTALPFSAQIVLWSVFVTVFPLWFYRYSKSLWLAIDHTFDPDDPPLHLLPR